MRPAVCLAFLLVHAASAAVIGIDFGARFLKVRVGLQLHERSLGNAVTVVEATRQSFRPARPARCRLTLLPLLAHAGRHHPAGHRHRAGAQRGHAAQIVVRSRLQLAGACGGGGPACQLHVEHALCRLPPAASLACMHALTPLSRPRSQDERVYGNEAQNLLGKVSHTPATSTAARRPPQSERCSCLYVCARLRGVAATGQAVCALQDPARRPRRL